jgi:pectate lyase
VSFLWCSISFVLRSKVEYNTDYFLFLSSNCGTRGPSGRFGHQHIYNNVYQDYRYQAIQSRSDNQMLVEANAFFGKTRTAATTYGLVIPEDSPNSGPEGDFEIDGYMNLGKSESFPSFTSFHKRFFKDLFFY